MNQRYGCTVRLEETEVYFAGFLRFHKKVALGRSDYHDWLLL